MKLNQAGQFELEHENDGDHLNEFLDKLAHNLHGRLPKLVQAILPEMALRALLGLASSDLIARF